MRRAARADNPGSTIGQPSETRIADADSATHGRFLAVDPIEGGCANDYVYVSGDPVNNNDLSGQYEVPSLREIDRHIQQSFEMLGDLLNNLCRNRVVQGLIGLTSPLPGSERSFPGILTGIGSVAFRFLGRVAKALGVEKVAAAISSAKSVLGWLALAGLTADIAYRRYCPEAKG